MVNFYSNREQEIKDALTYIPYEVRRTLDTHDKPIMFYTTHDRFGYSSAPTIKPYVILLNDIIFRNVKVWNDRLYRFFVFTVLHEIAHVYMDITGSPVGHQEESTANDLAERWYNERAAVLGLERISHVLEIKCTQKEVEKMMEIATEAIALSIKSNNEWLSMEGASARCVEMGAKEC